MQLEHIFVSEQVLQGSEHNTQILLEIKSYSSLQLKQFVEVSLHVLQFKSHFRH